MQNSASSHSTSETRSSRRRIEARFFFEPTELRGQFANLGVKLLDLLLMSSEQISGLTLFVKERIHLAENQIAPLAELIGMDLMLGSQLRKRLLFFKKFEDEFGFEGCRIVLFHGGSNPP